MKTRKKDSELLRQRVIALCLAVLMAVVIWLVVFAIHPAVIYGAEAAGTAAAEEAQEPYKISFNAGGGTTPVSSKIVIQGEAYGELPEPTRPGYLFLGWYTSLGNDGEQVNDGTVVELTRDQSLYARWVKDDEDVATHKLTFNPNGGSVSETSRQVKNGEAYGQLPVPVWRGHTFLGWFTKYRTGEPVTESTRVNLTKNTTLYAHWEEGPSETTITLQIGNPEMTINGRSTPIDEQGTAPVIRDNRTLLPVRAVIEALGGTVKWNEKQRQVSLTMDRKSLYLVIDSRTLKDNKGKTWEMDTAPIIENGRTLLPIRAVAEYFGASVEWEEDSRTVTITL